MDYFGHMNEDVVQMVHLQICPDVKAKAEKIKNAIRNGKYFAFTGPIKDNTGKVTKLKDGEVADDAHPNSMMYYVEGIDAKVIWWKIILTG